MTTEHEKMLITKYDLLFEGRLTKCETTMDKIEKRIDSFEKTMTEGFKEIRSDFKEVRSDFKWLFALMLGFSGILLGLMARGFHWL